jgi:hypothetical protein
MGQKIAFATTHKDLGPKPQGFSVLEPSVYQNPNCAAIAGFGPCSEDYPTGGGYRPGTQEEWTESILSQNSKFSGFPFEVPETGEVWNQSFVSIGSPINGGTYYSDLNEIFIKGAVDGKEKYKSNPSNVLVGPGTSYVGPFSLAEAVAMYWRVKKWSIGSMSATANASAVSEDNGWHGNADCDGITVNATMPPVGNNTFSVNGPTLIDEKSLITTPSLFRTSKGGTMQATKNSPGGCGGDPEGAIGQGGTECYQYGFCEESEFSESPGYAGAGASFEVTNKVVKVPGTDDYYIQILASIVAGAAINVEQANANPAEVTEAASLEMPAGLSFRETCDFSGQRQVLLTSPYPGSVTLLDDDGCQGLITIQNAASSIGGQLTITLPSPFSRQIIVPLYGERRTYRSGYWMLGDWNTTINASIGGGFSVQPLEYWEYDDGNGNPIYDKDTGAELRDPVTGAPV